MLVEINTLVRIDPEDVIDGVFIAPDNVLYTVDYLDCDNVVKMILPNVIEIGNHFLRFNKTLKHLEIPNVEIIGFGFLFYNNSLEILKIPKVKFIGDSFLYSNDSLESLEIPKIRIISDFFLYRSTKFNYLPNIISALGYDMYIGRNKIDKKEYLRKLNLKKILS